MNLETLTPANLRSSWAQAEELCLSRIHEILRQADPSDVPLRRLLGDIERQNRVQMDEVRHVDANIEAPDDVDACFPSLRDSLGEAPLNRDSAPHYVDSLKKDACRFFSKMARNAPDEDTRAIFIQVSLSELDQVARLRMVIL